MSDGAGRVALVTGAARGIGAAVARRLASDGLDVAVLDLDKDSCGAVVEAIGAAGGRGVAVGADVSDEQSVTAAVAHVVETFGAPTVLVNNAGIIRDNLLFRMSAGDWDAVLGVHLRGAFLVSRAVQAYMVEAGWGRIVNLSSTSALGDRGRPIARRPRPACRASPRRWRSSWDRSGCRSNAVAPGFIATDMTAARHRGWA